MKSNVGRPSKEHGSKIKDSLHKDTAIKWMISGLTDYTISQKLNLLGLRVTVPTVTQFRENHFNKLPFEEVEAIRQEIQTELVEKEKEISEKKVSYTNLDILEALDCYIKDIESRIYKLEAKSEYFYGLSPSEEKVLATYYRDLKEAREDVANNQLKYERAQVIKEIIRVVVELLKKHLEDRDEEKIREILRELITYARGMAQI